MPCFNCVFGDCVHLAMQEPGSFAVTDLLARQWICYPAERESPIQTTELVAVQHRGNRAGVTEVGSNLATVTCPESELPKMLASIATP